MNIIDFANLSRFHPIKEHNFLGRSYIVEDLVNREGDMVSMSPINQWKRSKVLDGSFVGFTKIFFRNFRGIIDSTIISSEVFVTVRDLVKCGFIQPLYQSHDIETSIQDLSNKINEEILKNHENDKKVLVTVLEGGKKFSNQLQNGLDFYFEVDFLVSSRYHNDMERELEIITRPKTSLKDKVVLLVDDFNDSGETLKGILSQPWIKDAKRVISVVLCDRVSKRGLRPVEADFKGIDVETNDFLFGFGMDYKNSCRDLGSIYAVPKF